MRVIDPKQFKKTHKKPQNKKERLKLLYLILLIATASYLIFGQNIRPANAPPSNEVIQQSNDLSDQRPATLKQFSGKEFQELYMSLAFPNTEQLTESPEITGNKKADKVIKRLAEQRGYKLMSIPVSNIIQVDEPYLTKDDLMQPNMLIAWRTLQDAAKKDKIPIQITSAYRSIEFQRALFVRMLSDAGISTPGIADGYSDEAVSMVLSKVAPPGYSRHHTGYAMDLACDGIGLEAFKATSCYSWISKNNFEQMKKVGFVPSYPEGVDLVGPEPESWEYVWVGTALLYE
jgi:zinc D-Ala-D-Ala carboxypeptidase